MNVSEPVNLPRWEWRTFGSSLRGLQEQLAGVATDTPRERRETYILCHRSSHSAKIREAHLNLKWRIPVDAHGLEQWDPVLSSAPPFTRTFLENLVDVWGFSDISLDRDAYTLAQFMAEVVAPNPELQALELTKQHKGFELGGVQCKFTTLQAEGFLAESFCAEHEDPNLLLQVIQELGLQGHANTNYPKGLKQILGLPLIQ